MSLPPGLSPLIFSSQSHLGFGSGKQNSHEIFKVGMDLILLNGTFKKLEKL